MTFASNVQPPKVIRPKPRPWTCRCRVDREVFMVTNAASDGRFVDVTPRRLNPGYLGRCPVCKSARPKEA